MNTEKMSSSKNSKLKLVTIILTLEPWTCNRKADNRSQQKEKEMLQSNENTMQNRK